MSKDEPPFSPPVALTVAGSDSGGGAGIQMDLAVFRALKLHGLSVITCLTAQNPSAVNAVHPSPSDFVRQQLGTVDEYFTLRAVKTGMLFNRKIIREVANFLRQRPELPAVIDPVMVASSGAVLLEKEAIQTLREELLPLAALVTPNLDEVGVLLDETPQTKEEMVEAGETLRQQYSVPFLLKGGHLESEQLVDLLFLMDGTMREMPSQRIGGLDTHGSGCLLAAAIAGFLAQGKPLPEAVENGLAFFRRAAEHPKQLNGTAFLNPA
ncbi:MAG: bifunctional hydroxymethylpyrimidine kinase/phosphomethylpyrimidine kinase [Opitutales bacterium]|nr:bifunctional hydroxymethylpyrimidine kinase/phosphomethylpyrimidine kinase [Opitutales bacterium]MCH8539273.1 bifunctional hydroxymethylpyrimidine kinase/phosphomethylpyrimidine kinase [Opitutales bacterium]